MSRKLIKSVLQSAPAPPASHRASPLLMNDVQIPLTGSPAPFLREGETILLVDRSGRKRLIKLKSGGRTHTNKGIVEHDELIDLEDGSLLRTSTGAPFTAWRPRLADYVLEMPRQTGIIYPKDGAAIISWGDIGPGMTVLEAGLGSGALTLLLLRTVAATGRVISYEMRGEFIELALRNIRGFAGEPSNLLIRERDITDGIVDHDIDRIVLDLPEPWTVIATAIEALVPGGAVICYSPSVVQVQQTVETIRASGWFEAPEVIETLYRGWHVEGQAVRPEQQMVGHTGFLTMARRLAKPWLRGKMLIDPLVAREQFETGNNETSDDNSLLPTEPAS